MRKIKKLKKWEKIFIICSIGVIVTCIVIYGYRAIHYYSLMNVKSDEQSLYEVITNKSNIVYSGDGLYNDDGYYFKGKEVNNYISYSGQLWRIVSITDNNIKLISDDILTSIVWGYDTNYSESYVNSLLKTYMESLDNTLIKSSKWCDSSIDINNYKCDNLIENDIGLLSTQEYLKAGGANSYLNINKYFWLINYDSDMKVYYVFEQGGINNEYKKEDTYYSYGVRPVINILMPSTFTGNGTKEDPYIISDTNNYKIGKNIDYKGYSFKILSSNEEYTKLILNDVLYDENNEKIKLNYNDAINYINNKFINNFKEDLVECKFNKNTYNNSNKYNYLDNDSYTGYGYLPSVGEIYSNEIDNVWLGTIYDKTLSYTVSGSTLFVDLNSNTNYIRPVICVNTNSLEDKNETNN